MTILITQFSYFYHYYIYSLYIDRYNYLTNKFVSRPRLYNSFDVQKTIKIIPLEISRFAETYDTFVRAGLQKIVGAIPLMGKAAGSEPSTAHTCLS